MDEFANPVARLLVILQTAVAEKQGTVRERWAIVFGVDAMDDCAVLRSLSELFTLVKEGKELVSKIGVVDQKLYMTPLNEVEAFFHSTLNLNEPWGPVRGRLQERSTLEKLAFCAETVEREQFELLIEKDELKELLESADRLLAEIIEADIADELKRVLVENMENLRRSILEYRITGAKGIHRAIDRSIGSLVRHRDELLQSKNKVWAKKVWEYLFHADSVVSKSLKLMGLVTGIQKLIGVASE